MDSSGDDLQIQAKWKPLVLALMTIALLLRLMAAILVERQAHSAGQAFLIEGDANGYWELGRRIAGGEDYAIYTPPRYVLRVPGFPLLLAASIKLFGNSIIAARIILAFVGTACCWLTYQLGAMLHMRRTGFWAALFVAVNPLHVGNSVLILSETWFTLWMLLSLIALARLIDSHNSHLSGPPLNHMRRKAQQAAVTGLFTGIATLIRPGYLPWMIVSCLAVLAFLKTPADNSQDEAANGTDMSAAAPRAALSARLLVCSALISGWLIVALPWAARNASVTGHWVFTSLWSGPSLYDGMNPNATGASNMQFFEDDRVMERMSEYEMNQHYKQLAISYAAQNPGQVVALATKKAGLFLSPVPNFAKKRGWVPSAVCAVFWILLIGCSAAGLRIREWNGAGLLVMIGPLVLFLLVHMVFVGSVRYRLPLEFPLAVLGAIGWRGLVLAGATGRTSNHS